MQLGDWVNFSTIVVKEETHIGSRPATQVLTRSRHGMVIGVRYVYDVEAGAPPALTNPQTVLLVAVSLHRSYRVFPRDAQPATPPQPRRTRTPRATSVPVAATGITTVLNQGGIMRYASVTQAQLELLVAEEINRQLVASAIFTAYDLTLALRAANPTLQLEHAAVRQCVHAQMEAIVATQLYERETANYGHNSALRYVPA